MNVSHTLGASAASGMASAGSGTLITPSGSSLFSWAVLSVALEASWKLFVMCLFVVVLVKNRLLPDSTAPVLSQVAFRIMIPCYMMTKVVVTLQQEPSWSLMGLPILAVLQILLGALLGKLGWFLVVGRAVKRSQCQEMAFSGDVTPKEVYHLCSSTSSKSMESLSCISYKSSDSEEDGDIEPDSMEHQAQGLQSRVGDTHLTPETRKQEEGSRKADDTAIPPQTAGERGKGQGIDQGQREALVMIASAFGNAGILPLVLISGLLGTEAADQAGGYLALYLIGWAPGLWTIGYQIITRGVHHAPLGGETSTAGERGPLSVWWGKGTRLLGQIFNPPLYGILLGLLIGATPLSHAVLPPAGARGGIGGGGLDGNATSGFFDTIIWGLLKPSFDAAGTLGSGFLSVQTVVMAASFASSIPAVSMQPFLRWVAAVEKALRPRRDSWPSRDPLPDVEECTHEEHGTQGTRQGDPQGVPLVYHSQEEDAHHGSGAKHKESAFSSHHGADTGAEDVPSGPVSDTPSYPGAPNQTHLSTHSLGTDYGSSGAGRQASTGLDSSSMGSYSTAQKQVESGNGHVPVGESERLESSDSFPEGRALLVICAVRLVVLPTVAAATIKPLSRAGFLPTNPLCLLLLMVQMCMPSAQNLVLVAQLHEETRDLASLLSSLLLKLYVIAILPITVWTSIFLHLVQQ